MAIDASTSYIVLYSKIHFTSKAHLHSSFRFYHFIILFMISSGWHSLFIKHHLDPVGNNHTQYPEKYHKIQRKLMFIHEIGIELHVEHESLRHE